MCIEIAKVLSKLNDRAYLLYLMPSLSNVPASVYVASSYEDDDLEFTALMLSDDGERLLHIPEILEFAEQDSVLKHTSLFNGRRCNLSIAEENRLLARHPTVENYYHAVRDKVNFELHGETAGAYLKRLISGLRSGGVHGSGTEFVAAGDSNLAIVDFADFLERLSKKNKKAVLRMNKCDRWRDGEIRYLEISHALDLLFIAPDEVEVEEEEQHEQYCVELIANDLEEILEENPSLYQLMPFAQEGVGTLSAFQETVKETKASMLTALNTSTTYRYFGAMGDDKLACGVLSKISRDRAFFLSHAEFSYVAGCYHDEDKAEIKALSAIILSHARDYMKRQSLREALSDLPTKMSRDVLDHVFPITHHHRFYRAEQNKPEKEAEPVAKKPKHTYFSI